MISYGRQLVDDDDIRAVRDVLISDWLTTGPKVEEFEKAFARAVGAKETVAVSSGTAALHAAMFALGIGSGDEVIVPAMTFAASANCVVFQGGKPVFADVDPETLLLDPKQVEKKITSHTRAVISVDYAGQPCDYDSLREITDRYGIKLVDDACHALGGSYKGRSVGSLGDLNTFSFHPVKHMTTGEGGMIATDNGQLAERMRLFRNHGIASDHRQRETAGSWYYEMVDLGYNYRITDIQCALGLSQLKKLPRFLARRRQIAAQYDREFGAIAEIHPLGKSQEALHAYHLYVVKTIFPGRKDGREEFFRRMRQKGIGVNVHYIPVHLHPFYRERFGTAPGLCPIAEAEYEKIVSLPMYPAMDDEAVDKVITAVKKTVKEVR